MTTRASVIWKVLAMALLAVILSSAFGADTAYAQGAIAQGDPTGAATGTAKDVTVKDAKNPTLAEVMETVGHNKIAINFVWTLLAGFLVMFMQAGFAMVETGFTRAKNAAHTMTHELHDLPDRHARLLDLRLCAADGRRRRRRRARRHARRSIIEFTVNLFGHPFGLFGLKGFFLSGSTYDVGVFALFLFQMVFMDTAGTIPTGAMAERWKFSAFIVFGFFMSMVVYPIFANWVWGGGWLSQLGAQFGLGHGHVDFAGSSVVHMVGGVAALAGAHRASARASASTPRPGNRCRCPATTCRWRSPARSSSRSAGSASIPGSTLAGGDLRIAVVATNTMLAGTGGAVAAMFYVWKRLGKPDPEHARATACSPGWWRSPRRARSSTACRRSSSAPSPACWSSSRCSSSTAC